MRRVCRAHRYPPASLSHRFARSPVDALVDLKVRCRLRCQIPVCWLDLRPVTHLRIAVIPQRWSARRGYVWGFRVHPDVIEDLSDLRALGNEGDQAPLNSLTRNAR